MHLRRSARLCQNRRVRTKRRYHTTQPVLLTALQLGYRLNPSRKVPFHPPIKRRQFDQINAYEISEGRRSPPRKAAPKSFSPTSYRNKRPAGAAGTHAPTIRFTINVYRNVSKKACIFLDRKTSTGKLSKRRVRQPGQASTTQPTNRFDSIYPWTRKLPKRGMKQHLASTGTLRYTRRVSSEWALVNSNLGYMDHKRRSSVKSTILTRTYIPPYNY